MTHNWAGNLRYSASRIHRPASVDEVRRIVAAAPRIRALGTRHSFNTIADSTAELLSTELLDAPAQIDVDARTVTVGAGTRYGVLARQLDDAGWALPAMASLPHISVGGAVATATHGSGDRTGNLATAVSALDIVTASGDLLTLRRGDPRLEGAVVSLGALGVVTSLTLDVEPSYDIEQHVYQRMPWAAIETAFDSVTAAAHSVSLFTTWADPGFVDQVWLKRRPDRDAPAPLELFGAAPATVELHPLPGISAENCTAQLGVAGRWLDRLPHFRLEFMPSAGEELQSEFLVPREHAVAALNAVRGLAPRIAPLLFVSEIRTIAADELWLSTAYETDAVALHFTFKPQQADVEALLPDIEAALAPFRARPHWGKLFTAGDVSGLYPRASDFAALRTQLDPGRKFGNEFLERHLP